MADTGSIQRLEVELLRLDPQNPRLPEEVQGSTQTELAEFISQAYDAIGVALSIAEHGFFESEPLIAVPDGDVYTVVEGNRRLTAVLGLLDPQVRARLDSPNQWAEAAEEARLRGTLPTTLPVLVVADRKVVAPIIGYRHISGIMQWEPYAKARFIAALVDDQHLPFEEVAGLVGERRGEVASAYRNFDILRVARTRHELDTHQVEESFGVFTAAMGQKALRTFIGAPDPGSVSPDEPSVPNDRAGELGELLTWIFGDESGAGRVISESRDLGLLAQVVSNERGLAVLRDVGDLQQAADATSAVSGDDRRRLINKLSTARTNLRACRDLADALGSLDAEASAIIEDCDQAIADLRDAAGGG